ncbi:MAG: ATP-binding protein [Pseudomonadota bacterium]|nr:ATP-binding protein [Pseudomonadota bacterium]
MPHGHCYLWIPWLLWLHVLSDFLIGTAYLGISLILWALVRKIRLPFSPVFIAFGLFIGLCGMTHFMEIWTAWNPDYIFAGFVKAATAAASVATAIGLFYVRPQVEEVVYAARLSEERRIRLESTHAELKAMFARVREAEELRSRFFANVSHELRTPLALILGPADQLLGSDNLTDTQRRQLASISSNGRVLLKQVNDLLDLAKLDFGNAQLALSGFDAAAWLGRIASQFEVAAQQRGIDFRIEAPKGLPVQADPDKLERVVVNLLSNAFKFTPRGGTVVARLTAHEDGGFRISVDDSGPGVPPEQRELIFERFRQVEGDPTRTHGGTGLGLAIVREFVTLHGGHVTVGDSTHGGAAFEVVLPVQADDGIAPPADQPGTDDTQHVALQGALHELAVDAAIESGDARPTVPGRPEVLLVEDNAEMRAFIADALAENYNVVTAVDGHDGLAKASAMRPDLIVTDVMMPRLSGDQLVHALRSDAQFDTVPILLLTAKADDELRVHLLAHGAQDYLTKPFRPQELATRARNLVETKRAGDTLRSELATLSTDIADLALQVSMRSRQLRIALDAAEVAREQAEQATKARTYFLGMISHELRTPLSTIQLNLQLLARDRSGAVPAAMASRLERSLRASQQMTSMVEGLLEYTRVESGQLQVRAEPLDPVALAREVVDQQIGSVPPAVELIFEPPAGELRMLHSDRRLLTVALGNLVANALKFTQQGAVVVSVAPDAGGCRFEVADSGMGIAEADLTRIFQPFEQLEPLKRKSVPGVGLGLALVQQIIHVLGGKVAVSSRIGMGTTFQISVPDRQDGSPR